MKRKIVACISVMAVLLLSACGTGDDAGGAVSLEPRPLEADNATGVSDMNGGSNSVTGINGGSGSVAAGTGGTASAGKENDASESGGA